MTVVQRVRVPRLDRLVWPVVGEDHSRWSRYVVTWLASTMWSLCETHCGHTTTNSSCSGIPGPVRTAARLARALAHRARHPLAQSGHAA